MSVGRPKVDVYQEEVEYLRYLRFSWSKIAEVLGISRATLYRRLDEWQLSRDAYYSSISDAALDPLVRDIKVQQNPNIGEVMLMSELKVRNIWVQRSRLRASIHRVDHHGTLLRRRETIRRRTYSVDGPNSLWHIDGNHKLIRWKIVIHGGIDGHSRTIVFLHCATNNRAETVLHAFRGAVTKFGFPQRVRTDQGGENVDVWRCVYEAHHNPSAVLVGPSTHNERIERLWRDVFRCVAQHYYDLFYDLESCRNLDPLNHTDLYCLHYVFLPRIEKHLQMFQESWNHHSLSTENNMSPYQILFLDSPTTTPLQALPTGLPPALPSSFHTTQHVSVPRSKFVPCGALALNLTQHINPTEDRDDFGRGLYLSATRIVEQHLLQNCFMCGLSD